MNTKGTLLIKKVLFLLSVLFSTTIFSQTIITVTECNLNGWVNQRNANTTATFTTGISTLGNGSLEYTTLTGSLGNFRSTAHHNTLLSSLTAFHYSTYIQNRSNNTDNIYVVLQIDRTGDGLEDDRLIFEPRWQTGSYVLGILPDQGPTVNSIWQTWDMLQAIWWLGPPLTLNPERGGVYFSLASYISQNPTAKIVNQFLGGGTGGIRLNVGVPPVFPFIEYWGSAFKGYIDAFTIGINGQTTIYDFEFSTPPIFLNNPTIVLNASCLGNDGNISIIPLSGTAPFVYSINGGVTYVAGPSAGMTFLNLGVGIYQLKIKDANGCESPIDTRTIVQQYGVPPTFLTTPAIVLNATCPGRTDGNISIIPTSGAGPFMYSINGGMSYVSGPNTGFTFTGLGVGTYQLRLKSGNGCESAIVTRTMGVTNPVCPPVSTEMVGGTKNKSAVAIEASPNPGSGQVRVQLQNFTASKAEVMILDSRGTVIAKTQIALTKHNVVNFDLSRHAPGLYFIKVASTHGIHSSKVLIQR